MEKLKPIRSPSRVRTAPVTKSRSFVSSSFGEPNLPCRAEPARDAAHNRTKEQTANTIGKFQMFTSRLRLFSLRRRANQVHACGMNQSSPGGFGSSQSAALEWNPSMVELSSPGNQLQNLRGANGGNDGAHPLHLHLRKGTGFPPPMRGTGRAYDSADGG